MLGTGKDATPSEEETSGAVWKLPSGSTTQYQPVSGCENRRSPSCGLPASVFSLEIVTELMTL